MESYVVTKVCDEISDSVFMAFCSSSSDGTFPEQLNFLPLLKLLTLKK